MKNPLVQIDAVNQYEKSNEKTSKDYPSLELVRLRKTILWRKKGKVLEYAFGSGCNTKFLLKKNYKVYAIDVSKNAYANLKKKKLEKFEALLLNKSAKKFAFKSIPLITL